MNMDTWGHGSCCHVSRPDKEMLSRVTAFYAVCMRV